MMMIFFHFKARRASSLTVRKESAAPLIDLKSIDFWSGGSRETLPVQPKLLSPSRRDTIASQVSVSIYLSLFKPNH